MPAGSVAAYQAALESTNTSLSYAMESTWATLPVSTFQGTRILSETLAHKKTRTRPPEVRGDRQAAPAITTQETASGTVPFPVYFAAPGQASQFDDWLSALVGGDWQAVTVIAGVGGDIALTSGGALTSTTAAKFAGILVGQVLKMNGFTNTVNNGFFRVVAVVSSTSLTLAAMGFVPVTETPAGTAAKLTFSNLRNGTAFKSIFIQQRLDPAGTKWFRYPGAYPTKGSLTLALNQFLQASFDLACQQELKGLTDASTGGIIAAPNTLDMDPVSGFKGVFWNDSSTGIAVDSVGFDMMNDEAAGEFFLGSPLAQGMLGGTFECSGKANLAFKDFTFYDQFRAETKGVFAVRFGDQAGNSYVLTIPSATLLFDSGVNNPGPNKMLMAPITIEAGPDAASGCSISIDRFSAAA